MKKDQINFSIKLCIISTLALIGVYSSIATAQCVEDCVAIHTFTGEAGGDQFGWVSENTGDIDKDGVDDDQTELPEYLVLSPRCRHGSRHNRESGKTESLSPVCPRSRIVR